jgi:molybdate-binding protein/DNA-binding XRE family transcriptional regulator
MRQDLISVEVRRRRVSQGLSQEALAASVGLSRQALGAIEAGRQVPSTAVALRLAAALGCAVEELFALSGPPTLRAELAEAPGEVSRVRLGQVQGRWVAHPARDGGECAADGLLVSVEGERAEISPLWALGELAGQLLLAGCAPLLGLLASRLGRQPGAPRAAWVPANSERALQLLERGLVHAAGVHLVSACASGGHVEVARARFPAQETLVVHLTRWRQGLAVAPGDPLGLRGELGLQRPGLRVARREPGAAARALQERLLPACAEAAGPLAHNHYEVAALVRWGAADVGVTIEGAALAAGLDFIPLAEERFDLLLPAASASSPPVARLLDLLPQRAFREEAGRLPGYDLSQSGDAAVAR